MEVNTQFTTATPLYKLQPLFKHRHGNRITLEDMKAEAADAREEFRTGLRRVLESAGVHSTQHIAFVSEGDGRVAVAGDHPDKAKINAAIEGAPSLVNAFHRAEVTSDLVAHAEEAIKFQKAYALDPRAAVAQYAYLFDKRPEENFSLSL